MRLLVLAGKNADQALMQGLEPKHSTVWVSLSVLSRGVRRLDRIRAHAVVLIPDPEDHTWKRAVTRAAREYGLRAIVLGSGLEEAALAAGAFDCLEPSPDAATRLLASLRHLGGYVVLEERLKRRLTIDDWVEEKCRIGSWRLDSRGDVHWSRNMRAIMSVGQAETVGDCRTMREHVHPEDRKIFDAANEATFVKGWPLDFEYRVLSGDRVRVIQANRDAEVDGDGRLVRAWGLVRDITAQKDLESLLLRRDSILQVLTGYASRFLNTADWRSGLSSTLERLGRILDLTRLFIFRRKPGRDGDEWHLLEFEWAAPEIPLLGDMEQFRKYRGRHESWRAALMRRRVVAGHVRDFKESARTTFEITGVKSILLVPIHVGAVWWGQLGLCEHRRERDWLPVEIESMILAANLFGSAIHSSTMHHRLMAANRSAEEASATALNANMTKSAFLASMSHEIRTPISGIMGMAEMLASTSLSVDQREHLDMIRSAAKALLKIVNEVLDLSKIEVGKMELRAEDFSLRRIIKECLAPFALQADLAEVVFRFSVDDETPDDLRGDPDRLAQILRNLVGNSLKFTEEGEVEVTVEPALRQDRRTCLRFVVKDTGMGIPESEIETVFESFAQVDTELHKKHPGTGLGLAISRNLVELMGGRIGVESRPGEGTTMTFTAWFDPARGAVAREEGRPEQSSSVRPLRLLLADDNPMNRKYLQHFLEQLGHHVTLAENGLEVLETLREHGREVDMVLMDVQMPEMSGIEATRAIRQYRGDRFDPALPIIALTAHAMKGDRQRMLAAGMDDYLCKPVDMRQLAEAMERNAEPGQGLCPVYFDTEGTCDAGEAPEGVLDMARLMERFQGNTELLKDILELFMMEVSEKRKGLDSYREAGDLEALEIVLHSISNITGHVLAMDVVDFSSNLEKLCRMGDMDKVAAGIDPLALKLDDLTRAVGKELAKL